MQKESINSMLLTAQQQIYNYAFQLRFNGSLTTDPYALYAFHQQFESRFREQSKPSHSYIGLIAMAILSSPERQLVLSDIYQWILDHYPYFRSRGVGWRNSIRHNLSLNECFVKAGRSTTGKGHYWTIHPANLPDFLSGDFRRRRAQRRVRQSMNLTELGDDEDDEIEEILPTNEIKHSPSKLPHLFSSSTNSTVVHYLNRLPQPFDANQTPRKRCFDVDSLLAPDQPKRRKYHFDKNENIYSPNSKSDGSTETDIFLLNNLC